MVLSKIFRVLEIHTFQGLAQEAVEACIQGLNGRLVHPCFYYECYKKSVKNGWCVSLTTLVPALELFSLEIRSTLPMLYESRQA